MTREEAIEELKSLEYYGRPFDNTPEMCEKANRKMLALKMAIESLSAENDRLDCTSCIKDGTDACPRGAGRAVDDEICEEYLQEE